MRVNSHRAAGVTLFLLLTSVFAAAIPASAQDDEIDSAVVHTYSVQPEAARVAVSIDLAITADKPNRSTSRGVTQYYFTGWYVVIPAEATELTVTDNGRDLVYERIEEGEVSTLDITFRRNIFYKQTANIEINYVLPSDGPRNEAEVQVNPAYAGFPVFDGTGSEEVGIVIEFPPGFGENEGFGLESLERRVEEDGRVIFENLSVPLYEASFGFVAAANTNSLKIEPFEVDNFEFELRAWPGDDEWANFVRDQVTEGTPLLTEMTGLDWPVEDVLEITESYSPYLNGYGGWYDPQETSIEIGDELDEHLIFHELGHVWFNDDLFTNRWITEGLADEFADALVEDLDGDRRDSPRASNLDDNAIPLSHWSDVVASRETEEWAYEASWKVMSEIADEVGIETIGSAVQAADERLSAYPGETDLTTGARAVADWRYFLDLLEVDVAVDNDDLTELFADWVVGESIGYQLDDRLEARATYAELVAMGSDWAAPFGVRSALSEWKFNAGTPIMAAASDQLEARDEVADAIASVDVAFPAGYESDYEDAESVEDLEQVGEKLSELKAASGQLVLAHELADSEPSLFTKLGLLGQDIDTQLAQVDAAFEANQLDDVTQGQAELETTLVDAEAAGKLRAGLAAGGMALLAILVAVLMRRRKKRKQMVQATPEVSAPMPTIPEPLAAPDTSAPNPESAVADVASNPSSPVRPQAPIRPEMPAQLPWDRVTEVAGDADAEKLVARSSELGTAVEDPPPAPTGAPPPPSHRNPDTLT